MIYEELPSNMRHLRPERVYQLAKERLFWPGMVVDIVHFVTRICSCVKKKPPYIKPVALLGTITTTQPMEIVSIDFLHYANALAVMSFLVVTDHLTCCTGIPYEKQNITYRCKKDICDFILRFGMPKQILHDQDKEFGNKRFTQLTKLCGVKQLWS